MQMDVIREMIQTHMPNDKVRNVWFLCTDIQNNILYGVSGNNNKLCAIAKISPIGSVEIIK